MCTVNDENGTKKKAKENNALELVVGECNEGLFNSEVVARATALNTAGSSTRGWLQNKPTPCKPAV